MQKKILLFSILSNICMVGMQKPSQDQEIAEVAQEINDADRQKEKLAALLYRAPFPEKVSYTEYFKLKKLCKPKYAQLLTRLLQRGIVNPNVYYDDVDNCRHGLLREAVNWANYYRVHPELIKGEPCAVVSVLLEAGADPNAEVCKRRADESNLPLMDAIGPRNSELLVLLFKYNADPNRRNKKGVLPLMRAIRAYGDGDINDQLDQYNTIKILLDYGARVDLPTSDLFDKEITTPWQYAQKLPKGKELIELFKMYPKQLGSFGSQK